MAGSCGPATRPRSLLLALGAVFACLLFYHTLNSSAASPWPMPGMPTAREPLRPDVANSTLGCQAILVVSSENTSSPYAWRQAGMRAAAERTGLQVQIRPKFDPPISEFLAFRSKGTTHPNEGSALAWMGHLDAMRQIVDHSMGSALIMEDDVDWDVAIKSQLAPDGDIAAALRNVSGGATQGDENHYLHPYGTDWDVLWLGHCGASHFDESTVVQLQDETLLPPDQMRALWGPAYGHLPDLTREVWSFAHATCTYAYVVSLQGARKGLDVLQQGGRAFDSTLGDACRDGHLRCLAVGPELFHQMTLVGGRSQIHAVDDRLQDGEQHPEAEAAGGRFWTMNIKHSARCNAGRKDSDGLVQCLPNDEEFEQYPS